jgi:predicted nucleotide-binding protein (sugar kinase/HSP70/actin superfamily)
MSKTIFDFPYTCPIIDGEFDIINNFISDIFEEHIENFFPNYYQLKNWEKIRNDFRYDLFNNIKVSLEKVRKTNIDMRKAAEGEIEDLKDIINELQEEIERLKNES